MARGKRVEIVKIIVDGVEVDAKECTKCGEVKVLTEFHKFKEGKGGRHPYCRNCRSKKGVVQITYWTTDSYRAKVYELYGNEYEVLGEYTKSNEGISTRHVRCGHKWCPTPSNFLRGKGCPKCGYVKMGKKLRKSHHEFVEEVLYLVGTEYTVLGRYFTDKDKVDIRHNVCGNVWPVRPSAFTRVGNRCPFCRQSKGESKVYDVLTYYGFNFDIQYKLMGCQDERLLPFDFVVFKRSGSVVLIEYDGEQHFRPVDFAGKGEVWARRRFRVTQRNDRIKNEYCRANGIPLIRIRYDQYDEIEEILTRELTKLGVTGKRPIAQETEEGNAA